MVARLKQLLIAISVIALAISGAPEARAEDNDVTCGLSQRTCAKEGFVIISKRAERLVDWRRKTDFFRIPVGSAARFLERAGASQAFALLIGSADLASGKLDALIQEIIARGGSVIVTRPTLDDADLLNQTTGLSGASWDDAEPALLYGVRNAIGDDGRVSPMAFVLFPEDKRKRSCHSCLNDDEIEWLTERIGRTPPVLDRNREPSTTRASWSPPAPATTAGFLLDQLRDLLAPPAFAQTPTDCADNPQGCLTELAQAVHISAKSSNNEDTIEADNFIYSARSFDNNQDYYYVDQEVQYSVCDTIQSGFSILNAQINSIPSIPVASIIQPSPGSTENATTVTSSVAFGVGGQAGYSSDGVAFNVAPSLTISNSQSTTIPAIGVSNQTDLASGVPDWFFANSPTTQVAGQDIEFPTSWIWAVDLSTYSSAGTPFVFQTSPSMGTWCNQNMFGIGFYNNIAQPFPTDTVELPVVSGVSPSSVASGQTFEISGTGFYPSLVEAVLLGGQALDTGNWSADTDSQITVTAPADPPEFNQALSVVVKTSAGTSQQTDVTVTVTHN